MATKPDRPLLTVRDIVAQLQVCPKTIHRWIARGELPVYRLGRSIRVSADDLAAFMNHRRRWCP